MFQKDTAIWEQATRLCGAEAPESTIMDTIKATSVALGIPCNDQQPEKSCNALLKALEVFVKNKGMYEQGEKELVPDGQICADLGLRRSYMYPEDVSILHKLNMATPATYFNNVFYYTSETVKSMSEKIWDIPQAVQYLKTTYPDCKISPKAIIQTMIREYPEKTLSIIRRIYVFADEVKKINPTSSYVTENYHTGVIRPKTLLDITFYNAYTKYVAMIAMGLDYRMLDRAVEKGIVWYSTEKPELIDGACIEEWKKFTNKYDIITNLYKDIYDQVTKHYKIQFNYISEIVKRLIEENSLSEFEIVSLDETVYTAGRGFYRRTQRQQLVKRIVSEIDKSVHHIKYTYFERAEQLLASTDRKNALTIQYLERYFLDRISRLNKVEYFNLTKILPVISSYPKELHLCKDAEIYEIIVTLPTKKSKEGFCKFITYLATQVECVCEGNFNFDRELTVEKTRDLEAYSLDMYMRFGALIFANDHIWYKDFLHKASSVRKYANAWLYCTLHYVGAWRREDYIRQLPHPLLPTSPNEILRLFKEERLPSKWCLGAVEQVCDELTWLRRQPKKTSKAKVPTLVLEIPESIREFMGGLFLVNEAHCQLRKKGEGNLLTTKGINNSSISEFAGQEYKDIFLDRPFTNIRATKSYLNLTTKEGDDIKLGAGYILASIARSHKFPKEGLSQTTSIYLQQFKEIPESQRILKELYERGVCSFVPYVLTKTIYGEENFNQLSLTNQTSLMNEIIGLPVLDTELVARGYFEVIKNTNATVEQLIIDYGAKDGGKDLIKMALKRLAHGLALGKDGKHGCISVALGNGCIKPMREHCMGCGKEMYLKAYLSELGSYINNLHENASNAKTKGSKVKNILLLQKVVLPIAAEVIHTLKTVYKVEDTSEYEKLLSLNQEALK